MTTITNLKEGLETLESQVQASFDEFKSRLETLTLAPNTSEKIIQIFARLEELSSEGKSTHNFFQKSQKLSQINHLSLQLAEFVESDKVEVTNELCKLSKELAEWSETYAKLIEAANLIGQGSINNSSTFQNYATGFEAIASLLEDKPEVLSLPTLKVIEESANIALKIEQEIKEKLTQLQERTDLLKLMRHSIITILWKVGKIQESRKLQDVQLIKSEYNQERDREEQIKKNQKTIKLLEKWREKDQNKQPTEEEIKEYEEIQNSLKKNRTFLRNY